MGMKSYGLVVLSPFAIHRKSVRKLPFTTIQGRHVFIRRYVGRQQLDAKVNGVAHLIMMRKTSLGLYFIIIIIISHLKNSLEVSVLLHPLLFHSHIHPPWLRKILVRQHAGRKAKSSNLWPSIDVDDDDGWWFHSHCLRRVFVVRHRRLLFSHQFAGSI